jgi:hypothetical protein
MRGKIVVTAVLCLIVSAPWLAADYRKEPKTNSGGGYTLKAMLNSRHVGPHQSHTAVDGKDWIVVLLKASPPGQQPRIQGSFQTPFSDITTGVGIAIASGDWIWFHGYITASRGKYKTWGGGVLVGSGQTIAAHDFAPFYGTRSVSVRTEDKLTIDWSGGAGPGALVRDILEGGEPQLDANEEVVWSGNDPVWNVPPIPALRVTCSLAYQGGGIVRYTYAVENLTGVDRTFAFPEITTASFPAGWSGTVSAYATATISVDDQPSDAVCAQHALGTLGVVGDPDKEVLRTLRVYVPTSRLATEVEATITAAGYDPLQAANVVHFQLSEPAEGALLYRVTNGDEETFEIVAELTGPLAAGTLYEFEDPVFPSGANRYSVKAGTGVNGHRSGEAVVNNP